MWCFPCTTKRSPLELFRFIIKYFSNQGIYILQFRVDEDGSLANCSDFCKLLFQAGITIQTTGGHSSDLNGNVEILNKLIKSRCGAIWANSGLDNYFWCYGVVHASALLNYLSYNHDKTMTAYEACGMDPSLIGIIFECLDVICMLLKKQLRKMI